MPGEVLDTYVQWQAANAEKSFLLRICFIKWGVNKESSRETHCGCVFVCHWSLEGKVQGAMRRKSRGNFCSAVHTLNIEFLSW